MPPLTDRRHTLPPVERTNRSPTNIYDQLNMAEERLEATLSVFKPQEASSPLKLQYLPVPKSESKTLEDSEMKHVTVHFRPNKIVKPFVKFDIAKY